MSLSSRWSLLVGAAFFLLAPRALADIMQAPPDGTIIPHITNMMGTCALGDGSNVQACLDDSEVMLGGTRGSVSAIHNATINQETFDPKCQLTFKVLSKGGSVFGHVFGWYPAKPGNTPPPLSDLHVFLNCMECQTPGTTKVLTLPPGTGTIAFFEASYTFTTVCPTMLNADGTLPAEPSYTMYTERRFNGRLRNGNPDPMSQPNFIRVLTWQSAARPDSFYFGWEDDGSSTTSDQNFEDLVTFVSGIECSSGGQACDTGQKGLCSKGTMQCRAGILTCIPDQTPIPEKCNAIDDNCDGNIDEGNPCPTNYVCFRGTCVPNCARGEFTCVPGSACEADAGVCVDVACQGVTCPMGQVCRGGNCVGECGGVKCPFGQSCRHGGCVDVCSGVQCDTDFVCTPTVSSGAGEPVGVCANCGCQGCPAGTKCTDKHCVPNDCASVSCMPGTHCTGGACVDNCIGAVCPATQKCDKGQCVPDATAVVDAGRESGPVVITTTTGPYTSGPGTGSGTRTGTGTGTGSGTGPGAGGSEGSGSHAAEPSCGCRVPGRRVPLGATSGLVLALGAALARRARRPQARDASMI